MGTWETEVYKMASCPCGKGYVERIVETPDGPWSRMSETFELDCKDCAKGWDIRSYDGTLTDRKSSKEALEASTAEQAATAAVSAYLNSLLSKWPFPAFKTQAAEFEYLSEKGLYKGTVGQYRYSRRNSSMVDLAKVQRNASIITELVNKIGDAYQYKTLVDKAKEAGQLASDKSKAVKYVSLPKKL